MSVLLFDCLIFLIYHPHSTQPYKNIAPPSQVDCKRQNQDTQKRTLTRLNWCALLQLWIQKVLKVLRFWQLITTGIKFTHMLQIKQSLPLVVEIWVWVWLWDQRQCFHNQSGYLWMKACLYICLWRPVYVNMTCNTYI